LIYLVPVNAVIIGHKGYIFISGASYEEIWCSI